MKRKMEIPKMSNTEIQKWYSNIRPIVSKKEGTKYLRKLSDKEVISAAYTWLNNQGDYLETVDFTKLSILADVKMLHKYGYYGFFKPSVGEIIRQIPKKYLEKVVAFELLLGGIGMNSIYKDELNAGFHVSIVRLFQLKDDSNDEAKHEKMYPNRESQLPIGMTEKEFYELKRLFCQE